MNDLDIDVLINKTHLISKDYIPSDLVIVDNNENNFHNYSDPTLKPMISKKVYDDFIVLQEAAKKENCYVIIDSAYRSYEYQQIVWDTIYNEYLEELKQNNKELSYEELSLIALQKTKSRVAPPGGSEHQSGYSFDIAYLINGVYHDEDIENTKESEWMKLNAYKYGFILRYPKGKENITGYNYEPWHYRYVGYPLSKELYENNLTLEEYYLNEKITLK